MKLLIISDTHGNFSSALSALDKAGPVDHIIHLGDELNDATLLERTLNRQLIKVPGNCDPPTGQDRDLFMTFSGVRVFMTHGHRYRVKAGLTMLHAKAIEHMAQAVLFGHTHEAVVVNMGGMLLVNPGTLSHGSQHSFAVVSIRNGAVSAEVVSLP